MATKNDPKQIEPKLVVTVRMNELHTPREQHPDSLGATHFCKRGKAENQTLDAEHSHIHRKNLSFVKLTQVATVPATVTCTQLWSTCCVKYNERNTKNKYPYSGPQEVSLASQIPSVLLKIPATAIAHKTNHPTSRMVKKMAKTVTPRFAFIAVAAVTIFVAANGIRDQTART